MPACAQITHFKASTECRSVSVTLDRALEPISQAPRLIRSYIGNEIKKPAHAFWVNEWVSKAACDDFATQPLHKVVADAARPALDGKPLSVHNVVFSFEDATPLGAPITAYVTFGLHQGVSMSQLASLVEQLYREDAAAPGCRGGSWGLITDKPNVYYVIVGWDTMQAHWDAGSHGRLKELIRHTKETADLWVAHAALKPYLGRDRTKGCALG